MCASFRRGEVTLVVSQLPEQRHALLDAVAARIVPDEGRVWVARVPVSRDTIRRIRGMVLEVDVHARPVEHRSLLWNVLVEGKSGHRALPGLLRLPRKSERLAARRALERVGLGGREVDTRVRARRGRSGTARARERAPDDAGGARGARDRSRARRRRGGDCARPVTRHSLIASGSRCWPALLRRRPRSTSRIASSQSPTVCSSSTARRPTSAVSASPGASAPRSPTRHLRELFTYPHCPQENPPSVPSNTLFAVL